MKKIIKAILICLMAISFIPYILAIIVASALQESIDINESD